MIIERHYSSSPEDEEYAVRAFMLLIKLLDNAENSPGRHPGNCPRPPAAGSRNSEAGTSGMEGNHPVK
ncbi:MAG: hypothetical protein ACOY40_02905 [Bacillota bacterium]